MEFGEHDFQFPIILSLHQYSNKGLKVKPFWVPHDVTTPNSSGEVLPVNLHNQLLIILSNSNKKYLVSHHVGNCYLNSWFLS